MHSSNRIFLFQSNISLVNMVFQVVQMICLIKCTGKRPRGGTRVRPGELRLLLGRLRYLSATRTWCSPGNAWFKVMLLTTSCLKYLQQKEALVRGLTSLQVGISQRAYSMCFFMKHMRPSFSNLFRANKRKNIFILQETYYYYPLLLDNMEGTTQELWTEKIMEGRTHKHLLNPVVWRQLHWRGLQPADFPRLGMCSQGGSPQVQPVGVCPPSHPVQAASRGSTRYTGGTHGAGFWIRNPVACAYCPEEWEILSAALMARDGKDLEKSSNKKSDSA